MRRRFLRRPMPAESEAHARIERGHTNMAGSAEAWRAVAGSLVMHQARVLGRVTSDVVWELCPPPVDSDPNVVGRLMQSLPLEWTGLWARSQRPSARSRRIRVYKPKE